MTESTSEADRAGRLSAAVQLKSLSKVYGNGASLVKALQDVTLTFPKSHVYRRDGALRVR
jgi:hypothetical protein